MLELLSRTEERRVIVGLSARRKARKRSHRRPVRAVVADEQVGRCGETVGVSRVARGVFDGEILVFFIEIDLDVLR